MLHKPTENEGAAVSTKYGRVARLAAAFGEEAADRLAAATVGVIGAGGTGSPALEVLARAGVGHLVVIDPDIFAESNLERLHGSVAADVHEPASSGITKAEIACRHLASINPKLRITAIQGRIPQPEVIDALVHANVVIGCTDQQHSRLALSDLAVRYLVPTIDCGVALEGRNGRVTGQVIQLVRLEPTDACMLCRRMTSPVRVAQELMSREERQLRRAAAERARERGEPDSGYWQDEPQLNTVGYLTTAAGALAAGYAIGWVTGRFDPPFGRLQMNLSAPYLDVTDDRITTRPDCPCSWMRGTADQGGADAFVTVPYHWPPAVVKETTVSDRAVARQ